MAPIAHEYHFERPLRIEGLASRPTSYLAQITILGSLSKLYQCEQSKMATSIMVTDVGDETAKRCHQDQNSVTGIQNCNQQQSVKNTPSHKLSNFFLYQIHTPFLIVVWN